MSKTNNSTQFLGMMFVAILLIGGVISGLSMISAPNVFENNIIRTAEATGTDSYTFAAVGDWGCTAGTTAMASKINSTRGVAFVLGLGDYSYTTNTDCWHNIIGNYSAVHTGLHLHNSTAAGNHENATCPDCSASEHLDTAGMATYLTHWNQNTPPSHTTYFSFNHNRTHFLVLDTNLAYGNTSAQYAFAKSDLNSSRIAEVNGSIDWIFVAMHHPMYTSPINNGCASSCNLVTFRNLYQPLFDQYKVDVVFNGHIHAYERSKPLKTGAVIGSPDTFDYANPDGQIYLTIGTGGRSEGGYAGTSAWTVKQDDQHFGFLEANVTRTTFSAAFIDTTGVVRDSFNIVKTAEILAKQAPLPAPVDPTPNPPSYYFSGSNYTGVASNSTLKLSTFSVAAWFNTVQDYTAYTVKSELVNKGGFTSESAGLNMNYGIWINKGSADGNKIEAGFESSTGTDKFVMSTQKYNDGHWHYALVTYDKVTLRLYIDGVQVSTLASTLVPDTGNQDLRLGADGQDASRKYTGSLDEIRVWNRAITSTEVSTAYNSGTFNSTGLVAYFHG